MRLFYIIGIAIAIVSLFINYTYSLGVLMALAFLLILSFVRDFFNKRVMQVKSFSAILFFGYMAIIFVLMFIALGLAFVFSDYISPYAFATTIVVQRIFMFFDQAKINKAQSKNL